MEEERVTVDELINELIKIKSAGFGDYYVGINYEYYITKGTSLIDDKARTIELSSSVL